MLIVKGRIIAKPDTFETLLALSLTHVYRSRIEPGCISHAVHQDAENPLALVFFEEWENESVLADHFAVPTSREFVKAIRELVAAPPEINIYSAAPVQI